jgi:hypothetical protein
MVERTTEVYAFRDVMMRFLCLLVMINVAIIRIVQLHFITSALLRFLRSLRQKRWPSRHAALWETPNRGWNL